MLKKKLSVLMSGVIAATFVMASTTFASPVAKINTFNTSSLDTANWNIPNGVELIETDTMPFGYAIRNKSDVSKYILVSTPNVSAEVKDLGMDFVNNDYYASWYFSMSDSETSQITTIANSNFGLWLFDALGDADKNAKAKSTIAYSATYGYRPLSKIGTTRYDAANAAVEKDKVYKVSVQITGGETASMVTNVYDVASGQSIATTIASTGALSAKVLKLGGSNWGGVQMISDFKLNEVTQDDKSDAADVYADAAAVTFAGVSPVIEDGVDKITLPEQTTGANGSTITYSGYNTNIIDEAGNVFHSFSDKNTFIKATVTKGSVSTDVAYAVKVCKTETKKIASDDFASAGSALSSDYNSNNGFAYAWRTTPGLSYDSTASIETIANTKMAVIPSTPSYKEYNGIYNRMSTPIDMDADATYYAKWVWDLELPNYDNGSRYAKTGFLKDGENTNEISAVWMLRRDVDKAPWVGIKTATTNNWDSTSTTVNDGHSINLGSVYNVMMKVKSNASTDDEVCIKIWPLGTSEPQGWTYTKTVDLTGTYTRFFSSASTSEKSYVGDIKVEGYSGNDAVTVDSALDAATAYLNSGNTPATVEWPLENSIAEQSFNNICGLYDKTYIKDVIFTSGDTRITNTSYIGDGEDVKVNVTLANDSAQTNTFSNNVYAAVFNNGVLDKVVSGTPDTDSIATGEKNISVDLGTVSANATVKVYTWNEELVPYISQITANGTSIKNY